MQNYQRLNKKYNSLFGKRFVEDDESNEAEVKRDVETFGERWGWIYNAELIKGFEGIKLEEVWNLPIIQALNALAYLKDKARNEREQIQEMNKSYGNGF